MNRKKFFLAPVFVLTALLAGASAAPAQTSAIDGLIKRMSQVNSGLQSYTATTHVDVTLHTLLGLAPALDGTYYYKQPDKQAIVFDTVPAVAQAFQRVYPKFDPPSRWPADYKIALLSSDASTTTLRMVPKNGGRVAHLDVKIDNANATPTSYTWTYTDGGYVTFDQQYAQIGGNYLVKSQSGKVELPSYKADVVTSFSNFKVNVPIPDKVFEGG
ncbi:MAG: hypothetical protein JO359_13185 [Candidatus Eremiobacteraeota bacterium]|nr:hypothetical protein [Candidatus Eremiobacteraeota bacterium]